VSDEKRERILDETETPQRFENSGEVVEDDPETPSEPIAIKGADHLDGVRREYDVVPTVRDVINRASTVSVVTTRCIGFWPAAWSVHESVIRT